MNGVLEHGRGDAVVFLHGIGGGARAWEKQLPAFAKAHRAIAWDLPGYGGTPALSDISFDAIAGRLAETLDALGVERCHLVGHSLGGMVAQTFAARHPDKLQSLTLFATSPAFGNPDGDFQKKFVAARLGPLDDGKDMAAIAEGVVPRLVAPDADAKAISDAVACMTRVPEATYRDMVHLLVTFDGRDALAKIAVPTLVLAGEHDATAPAAMMERMAGRIPGAVYRCLPGVGHLANLEDPTAFDAALFEFLDTLPN